MAEQPTEHPPATPTPAPEPSSLEAVPPPSPVVPTPPLEPTNPAHPADPAAEANLADELARSRARVDFYESFDRVIQENIARSADLLRQAAAEREAAAREALAVRAELDRRAAAHRSTLVSLAADLATLAADLATLGDGLATLAARVAHAFDHQPAPDADPAADHPPPPPQTAHHAPTLAAPPAPLPAAPPDPASITPTAAATATVTATATPTTLIVHGLPRTADVLSLQRHLTALPHVAAVETREYSAGVLRLQLTTAAPLLADDLRGWESGANLHTINDLPHLLEVALAADPPPLPAATAST